MRNFSPNNYKTEIYDSSTRESYNTCTQKCDYESPSPCTLIGTMEYKKAYYEDNSISYMSEMFTSIDGSQTGAFFHYISCATDICNLQTPDGFQNSNCIAVSSVERYYYYGEDGTPYMIEVTKDIDDISYYRLYQQLNLSEVPTPLKAFNDVLVGEVTVLPSSVPSQSTALENRNNPHPCPMCAY